MVALFLITPVLLIPAVLLLARLQHAIEEADAAAAEAQPTLQAP